jgi:hypothetical protein
MDDNLLAMKVNGKQWRVVWICLTLLAIAAPLAFFCLPQMRPSRLLVRHLSDQLATAPDGQVSLILQQTASLEEEGLPLLVVSLNSSRSIVADEANQVLLDQIDQWALLESRVSSPKVARLASLLAEHNAAATAEISRRRVDLATRLLLWPVDRSAIDATQLVADCETILQSTTVERWTPGGDFKQQVSAEETIPTPYSKAVARDETLYEPWTKLPGGGLPMEIAEVPELPRTVTTVPDELTEVAAPRPLPGLFVPPPAAIASQGQPGHSLSNDATDLLGPRSANTISETVVPLQDLPDLAVIHELASTDESTSSAALQELHRRGYEGVHLELAQRIVDPDSSVRLALVDALPQIPGVDARPWLIWLTEDDDPMVRKMAVTVIATSNDPSLRERLREIEREESDPEVLTVVRGALSPSRERSNR